MLDVGCGIGGSAFYMARDFDVKVVGIDLSSNMISLALERREEVGISVEVKYFYFLHNVLLSLCKQTSDLSIGYNLISTCASACD